MYEEKSGRIFLSVKLDVAIPDFPSTHFKSAEQERKCLSAKFDRLGTIQVTPYWPSMAAVNAHTRDRI